MMVGDYMIDFIRLAVFNDSKYGLITEFLNHESIIFAYTKGFNNKYTYEFVSDEVNRELIRKYLSND